MKQFYHKLAAQWLTAIPLPPILRMWTGDPLRKNVGMQTETIVQEIQDE